jgi:hypothetical protein
MTSTRISAEVVTVLRLALLLEVGVPANKLGEASITHEKAKHPELFEEPLAELDEYRTVLDILGWSEPERQEPVSLDLDRYRGLIAKALYSLLEVERDCVRDEADNPDPDSEGARAAGNARVIEVFVGAHGLTARE